MTKAAHEEAMDAEIERLGLEGADPLESIAATIVAALYSKKSKSVTLIFSEMTSKQNLEKFAESSANCSIMDPGGKKKKGQPLHLIVQRVSEGKIVIKFGLDVTRDDFIKTGDIASKTDITTEDTVAFSTFEAGCIRVLPITENFLEGKVSHKK